MLHLPLFPLPIYFYRSDGPLKDQVYASLILPTTYLLCVLSEQGNVKWNMFAMWSSCVITIVWRKRLNA